MRRGWRGGRAWRRRYRWWWTRCTARAPAGWAGDFGYALSRWLPDHVTAVSHAAAAAHLCGQSERGTSLSVLVNGIDVEAWRPDARTRATVRRELRLTDEFLWIAVGRLEAVKDYPTLLRAMKRARRRHARLLILGAGPLEAELARLAAELEPEEAGAVPGLRAATSGAGCRQRMDWFFRRGTRDCPWCCWRRERAGCRQWPPMWRERRK